MMMPRSLTDRTVNLSSSKRDAELSKVVCSASAGTRYLTPYAEGVISEHLVVGRIHEVPPNPEQVLDDPVNREESLRLTGRLEPAHLSLSLARRLVGDLRSVVRVLRRIMDDRRHCAPPCSAVDPQLVGHQPPRFAALAFQELAEEALCGASIATRLDEDVDHIAALVDGTPEIPPLALDRDEELVQVPRVTQSSFSPLQRAGVIGAKLPAPLSDGLVGDGDSAFRQEILDVPN